MAEELITKNVTKLVGNNYQTWKFQVTALLMANGVFDIVSGDRVMPGEEAENQNARKQWVKDNAKAMIIISTSIGESQLECLLTCTSAKQMWDQLSSIHEQKTASNKLVLTQRFHEHRMSTNDSVVQHIAKIRNMASTLRDLGENVSDISVMAKILGSLPAKYHALQTAWDSVPENNQTIDNLQERLIKEESRLMAEEDHVTALAVTNKDANQKSVDSKPNKGQKNKKKKDFECFYCHKKGHYERNCRKKKGDMSSGQKKNDAQESAFLTACFTVENDRQRSSQYSDRQSEPTSEQVRELLESDAAEIWITDSGASKHITYRREWLSDFRPLNNVSVSLGDNGIYQALGSGTVFIERLIDGNWQSGRIDDVLYVPQIKKNLFSVGICTTKGFNVFFSDRQVSFLRNGETMAQGIKQNNEIYRMFFRLTSKEEANVSTVSLQTWHERLGHINKRTLSEMAKKGLIKGIKSSDASDFFCESCQIGKSHRLPFHQRESGKPLQPGELFHSDVCGPMSVESVGGARYYVIFKDDATGFRKVYFIKHKNDVFQYFKELDSLVRNRFGRTIKRLRTDNGREYCSGEFKRYLAERGIQSEYTAPYTPEQNGKAERDNRTIVESARTMLHSRNLPLTLWAEAVNTAVYTLNRTPCAQTPGTTPYEMWTGKVPNLSYIKIFGSDAYAHVPKQFRTKLDQKAKKVTLVGYQEGITNYRLYDSGTRRVFTTRDVTFNEQPGHRTLQVEESKSLGYSFQENQQDSDEENDAGAARRVDEGGSVDEIPANHAMDEEHPLSPAQHQHGTPADHVTDEGYSPPTTQRQLRDRSNIKRPMRYEINIVEVDAPMTYQEATGPDALKWAEAIKDELRAHQDNNTWTVMRRTQDQRPIDSKWVFKIQRTTTEDIQRYKARLCARGFKQKEGLDYKETFSPVVRYDSLRILLAIVAEKNLELVQFDVKTAFLYGELTEELFMEIPEGLTIENAGEQVCKLNKSIYGLKQASRCWNQKFSTFLKKFNLTESAADPCIFKGHVEGVMVYLALYVDDGLIVSKSQKVLDTIIRSLRKIFNITLGDASSFIGLQIERNRQDRTIFIYQEAYINRLIDKFLMTEAKTISISADPHTSLTPAENNDFCSTVPFREAVGSLMFLAMVSRPDIMFSVNVVSRYLNCYNNTHWQAVKRIFRYLRGTADLGITYKGGESELKLEGYSDADYASDLATRRSTTGYTFILAGGPVSWTSRRQKLVTLSTTEAEYVAAAAAAKEAIWLRKLLSDLGCQCQSATTLFVDNQSAIRLTKNPEFHQRTKHIDIRYHYIREKVQDFELCVNYIPTALQRADIFTKPLPKERFKSLTSLLGLVYVHEALKRREC